MSAGHSVAVSAVPFFDLLDREASGLVLQVNEADSERGVSAAMEDSRRRLAQGVDAFVRALPAAIRNDPNQSRAAAYALVGLADERMLHYPAGGLERWRDRLLEFELYGSALAGQEIIRAAELAAQGAAGNELGVLYLALFREGFEGSMRGDTHGLSTLTTSLEETVGVDRGTASELLGEGGPKRTGVAPVPFALAGIILWLLAGFGIALTLPADTLDEASRIVDDVRIGVPVSASPTLVGDALDGSATEGGSDLE
ncbi:MAG: DotU family type IV/VI secretion system protein [Gammaproteobacteria bacterium]|nr:DotU family type IV/VI secretion system protein [Gammaproteobacteria bacterium]